MVMGHRQDVVELRINPFFTGNGLAFRAVPVAA